MLKTLFDSDSWREIYEVLRKNKSRTIITMIGVSWGIFLLIALLGAAKGFENSFEKNMGGMATNSVFVWTQVTSKPFKGFQKGRPVRLFFSDVEILKKSIKGIEYIAPRNQTNGNVAHKFQTGSYNISGDYPILDKVTKKNLLYGRFLNTNDIDKNKKVAVISKQVYEQLFEKEANPVGEYIEINNANFKVIGVFKPSKTINFGDEIHIPFTTFQQIYNQGNKIGWMMITGKKAFDIKQLEADIKLQLKTLHKVHPEDTRAFGSYNLGETFKKISGFLFGMQFLTVFVGLATLLAGVFAIGNILLITVKERTKEIGIRRALGAKPWEIKTQIILESIVLTILAGIIGIIGGAFVLFLMNTFSNGPDATLLNSSVEIKTVLAALTILVVLGSLIGMIPASRAVSIKPIEALRVE